MAGTSGIRWPESLKEEIEKTRIEDRRGTLTDQVIYLVELGLEERALRKEAEKRDIARRRGHIGIGPSIEEDHITLPSLLRDDEVNNRKEKGGSKPIK
jgi:hypothetical protein